MSNYNDSDVYSWYYKHVEDLEEYSGGKALGYCPFHDDVSSGKKSFSINLSTSKFKCHSANCGVFGNALSFARKLNVPIPSWAGGKDYAGAYAKALENDKSPAIDYLLYRGIPQEYVKYLDEKDLIAYDNFREESTLVFPVFSPEGYIIALNRVNLENKDKQTWGPYTGGYWIDSGFKFKGTIIIVEAVINAITLNSWGYNSMSIITAGNSISPEIFKRSNIVLVMDNDAAGRKASRRITRELSSQVKSIKAVTWPSNFKTGFDPNDLTKLFGNSSDLMSSLIKKSSKVDPWGDFISFRSLVNERRV